MVKKWGMTWIIHVLELFSKGYDTIHKIKSNLI